MQNRFNDYPSSHPRAIDVLLLIEVTDSSLSYDQEIKVSLYTEAKFLTIGYLI